MMMPIGIIDSVTTGRITYLDSLQFSRLNSADPFEPMPVAGRTPSSTAKMMTSTMPSQ